MNRYRLLILLILLVSCICPRLIMAEHIVDDSKKLSYLFVQTADSGKFDGKTLTLKIASPVTVYFSDRPYRIAGHMPLKKFIEDWNKGVTSFKDVPPNGVLSIFTDKGTSEIVVTLTKPKLGGNTLQFEVIILKGDIPKSFGIVSLFIDERAMYFGLPGLIRP